MRMNAKIVEWKRWRRKLTKQETNVALHKRKDIKTELCKITNHERVYCDIYTNKVIRIKRIFLLQLALAEVLEKLKWHQR